MYLAPTLADSHGKPEMWGKEKYKCWHENENETKNLNGRFAAHQEQKAGVP